MDNNLHLLITSEKGETKAFVISKKLVRNICLATLLLVAGGLAGWMFSMENAALRVNLLALQGKLSSTLALNEEIRARATQQEREQQTLLQNALTELKQRSQLIESIINSIGIKLEVKESSQNAGGPFAALSDDSYENLTVKVDHYLKTISSVPLGPPAAGTVTSTFGGRIDPLNGERAFHSGVDIKNKPGTEIVATADGTVVGCGYNDGFGNYLVIDHGHGFVTRYLHMQKSLVKKDDAVRRGERIGLMGNSGRSTGPHLHYEINYREKAINPMKFLQAARQFELAQQHSTVPAVTTR